MQHNLINHNLISATDPWQCQCLPAVWLVHMSKPLDKNPWMTHKPGTACDFNKAEISHIWVDFKEHNPFKPNGTMWGQTWGLRSQTLIQKNQIMNETFLCPVFCFYVMSPPTQTSALSPVLRLSVSERHFSKMPPQPVATLKSPLFISVCEYLCLCCHQLSLCSAVDRSGNARLPTISLHCNCMEVVVFSSLNFD